MRGEQERDDDQWGKSIHIINSIQSRQQQSQQLDRIKDGMIWVCQQIIVPAYQQSIDRSYNNQMKTPFIFTFNIRRSVFEQFGTSLFHSINHLKLQSGNVLLLPIVNNLNDGIEIRAQSFSRLLPELLRVNQASHCHLISYSLSGIDARCAISKYGINKYAKSLTTIATPHLGSRLAWLSQRKIFSDKKSEPISRLLGIGLQPFWQVIPQNMKHFNRRIQNQPEVKYFSIGAERLPNNMNEHLQETGNYLRQETTKNFVYENDGIVGYDECQWGQHLVNFEADHTEIVGLNKYKELVSVFQLIEDNVAHHDEATA